MEGRVTAEVTMFNVLMGRMMINKPGVCIKKEAEVRCVILGTRDL